MMQFLKARVWDEAVVLIGLIAHTHNDLDMTNRALALFRERQVELVLHAGDFSSPRIISLFQVFNARFVRGNADIDIEALNERCRCMGRNVCVTNAS
jgi:predicted phosphodiesterase